MFEIKAQQNVMAGKNPGIHMYGNYVTPQVHEAICRVMNDSFMESTVYQARQKYPMFFQGGSRDAADKYIFIEFLTSKLVETDTNFIEAMRLIQLAVNPHIGSYLTEIQIDPYKTEGSLAYAMMIVKDTDCPYDGGVWNGPFTFKPENNIQHYEVYKLCKYVGLHVINDPMAAKPVKEQTCA